MRVTRSNTQIRIHGVQFPDDRSTVPERQTPRFVTAGWAFKPLIGTGLSPLDNCVHKIWGFIALVLQERYTQ